MTDQPRTVLSEDPNAGLATPLMDLIAAGILAAVSLWLMVESLRLPMPGGIATAPGLLPFLTAASLMMMALVLGADALTRRRKGIAGLPVPDGFDLPPDFRRSMALGVILIVYVAALEFASIEIAFELFGLRFIIGAFETVTVIVLAAILRIYWQAPLWTCAAVSFGWIAFLSIVFRLVFHQQLP
ncbi:MAG: hypothetical protein GEU91_03210 [Rhizobiales bacterium]|nr:hypothetical protein [Hyphomicrobiales bacterium]